MEPWCTKDPRSCAKLLGFIDMSLSIAGLIILLCLSIYVELDEDVNYIHQVLQNGTETGATGSATRKNYTLNVTDNYKYDCLVIRMSIQDHLDQYLQIAGEQILYQVILNKTMPISATMTTCEVHVLTTIEPSKLAIIINGTRHSVISIVAIAVSKHTGEKEEDVREKLKDKYQESGGGDVDEISKQTIYPIPVGDDPEKRMCIYETMASADTEDVQNDYDLVYNLLMFSAFCSFITGIAVTTAGWQVQKCLLISTLALQLICVVPLVIAIILVNQPSLCLLQYGGIRPDVDGAPTAYLQTIITYTGAVYLVGYKAYCCLFLLGYLSISRKMGEVKLEEMKVQKEEDDRRRMEVIRMLVEEADLEGKEQEKYEDEQSLRSSSLMSESEDDRGKVRGEGKNVESSLGAVEKGPAAGAHRNKVHGHVVKHHVHNKGKKSK